MPFSWTILPLLFVAAFALSTWLEPRFEAWAGPRAKSDILSVALGDSRRLFAKHLYVKADAYFHSGYYPTVFDNAPRSEKLHIANGQSKHEQEEASHLGQPRDWIDRFSRHFYPSTHRHLGEKQPCSHEGKCDHDHGEDKGQRSGEERELLPWLKLSAQLDPQRPETYVVAAYWLRSRLGKIDEAEQFLRAGLRANPRHYEMLLELGRIYYEDRKQIGRARNLWELGVKSWREKETHPEEDLLVYEQLLGQLARLEEEEKNYSQALIYLEALKTVSPIKHDVQKWIDDVKQKMARPTKP
jgi:tetratricopeptide (TPR) repeat protein